MEAENRAGVNLTHLFAADVLLPVQVVHPPADRWLHRLCLAILEDALKYLEVRGGYGGRRARARQRHETWEWFLSDAEYCFSFTTVCSVLNLNAEAVRRAVRRRRAQGGAALSDGSRGLRQPLSRVSSASGVKNVAPLYQKVGHDPSVRGRGKSNRRKQRSDR